MTACAGPTASPTHAFPTLERHTPTPTVDFGPVQRYAVGQPIELSHDGGTSSARLTVTRVAQVSGFGNIDIPRNGPRFVGPVFVVVELTFDAIHGSYDYSPYVWDVVDGSNNTFDLSFPPDKPRQALGEGTLSEGSSISGWLVFEVAPDGLLLLSPLPYTGTSKTTAPPWVVVLRNADDRVPTGTPVPAGATP
jgi:hypothetical protein